MIEVAENLPIALSDDMPLLIDVELESRITGEITSLWTAHVKGKATTRRTKLELEELRCLLGERLSEMNRMLVSGGRGDGWAA